MYRNRILYEDDDLIVCHKPAGIATQTGRIGQADMVSELENYLTRNLRQGSRQNESGEKCPFRRGSVSYQPRIYVVHRLDQPVEGILVFAKRQAVAANLSAQAAGEKMEKEYLAVVCDLRGKEAADGMQRDGRWTGQMQDGGQRQSGTLKDYLLKDGKTNMSCVVPPEVKGAKKAELDYEILSCGQSGENAAFIGNAVLGEDGNTRVDIAVARICLHTGRHHQIRVQMSNAGMPLLGDHKYADRESIALSEKLGIRDTALCAYRLSFFHPQTGERLHFEITPEGTAFRGIRF